MAGRSYSNRRQNGNGGSGKTNQEQAEQHAMTRREQQRAMDKAPAREDMAPFMKILEGAKDMIAEVADSTLLKPDRLIYIARAGLSRSPELLQCTPISWVGALMDCAQLGLEPVSALGQFYFVAYKNWKANNRYEVNGQLGYLGIQELARRSGEIKAIFSEPVFYGDEFTVEMGSGMMPDGTRPAHYFRHRPRPEKRTEEIVAAWAVARFKDDTEVFKVVDRVELEKAKSASQAGRKDKGPWNDWRPQMSAKTAVRRMRPSLPQSTILAKALSVDESVDHGHYGGPGSRWRDLGDKASIIDQRLEQLEKHPTRTKMLDVPIDVESDPSDESPPHDDAAASPPVGEKKGKTKKAEAKPETPRSTEELVEAFAKLYKVSQDDLEAGLAAEGEPPLPASEWGEAERAYLEGTIERAANADSPEAMREVLQGKLNLEPGTLG